MESAGTVPNTLPPVPRWNLWIFLGLMFFALLFWNRFLRLRLPRSLESLQDLWLCGWLSLCFLGLVIFTLWKLQLIHYSPRPQSRMSLWLERIPPLWFRHWEDFFRAPEKLVYLLWARRDGGNFQDTMNILLLHSLEPCLKVLTTGPRKLLLLDLLVLIPSCIPSWVFFLEITQCQRLYYFYFALLFLLPPSLFRAWLFWVEFYCQEKVLYMDEHFLDIQPTAKADEFLMIFPPETSTAWQDAVLWQRNLFFQGYYLARSFGPALEEEMLWRDLLRYLLFFLGWFQVLLSLFL